MSASQTITLNQPSVLEYGANSISRVGLFCGSARTMVLTSPAVMHQVAKLGLQTEPEIYTDIPAESDDKALDAVLAFANSFQPEVVIGLGGGSVMDISKLVAVIWDKSQSLTDVAGPNRVNQKLSKLVLIPTTAGTGSEAGIRALVTNSETHGKIAVESPHMRADIVILDPTLTFSVPKAVTAATGVDAMAHCVEAYTSLKAHPMIDGFAERGMALVGEHLRACINNPEDTLAREGMMLASYYGGVCLGPVNTAAGHALAYPLSTQLSLPHGLANAIIFPHVLAWNATACPEKTEKILGYLGLRPTSDPESVFDQAYGFCTGLGIEMQISKQGADPEKLLNYAQEAHAIRRLLDNNPRDLSVEDITEIYRRAF